MIKKDSLRIKKKKKIIENKNTKKEKLSKYTAGTRSLFES